MIGSDITVGGFFRAQPFALDYYLTERSQCDYASTKSIGVCPDGDGKNDVTMISGVYDNGIVRVTFRKPLNNTNDTQYDHAIDPNIPMYALWAFGPYQDTSTEPVILAHTTPENHANSTGFTIKLNQTINACPRLMPANSGGPPINRATVIEGVTYFEATVEPDQGYYPNPPSWGVSWRMNGKPTPVIKARRGVTLTFNVRGTDQHPFYITNSLVGGNSSATEVVYAGGPDSFGTDYKPYVVSWTPPENTPAVVYYQCYTHQKLGWKIEFLVESSSPVVTACWLLAVLFIAMLV